MTQQINLYNPQFLKQEKHFSARTIVQALGLIVDQAGVFLKDVVAFGPCGVLQFEDRFGIEEVVFAFATPLVFTTQIEIAVGATNAVPLCGDASVTTGGVTAVRVTGAGVDELPLLSIAAAVSVTFPAVILGQVKLYGGVVALPIKLAPL